MMYSSHTKSDERRLSSDHLLGSCNYTEVRSTGQTERTLVNDGSPLPFAVVRKPPPGNLGIDKEQHDDLKAQAESAIQTVVHGNSEGDVGLIGVSVGTFSSGLFNAPYDRREFRGSRYCQFVLYVLMFFSVTWIWWGR